MPTTSETLALFVQALVQEMGYGHEYARVACNAVRWVHRKADVPPPDRHRAWYVLRYGKAMPPWPPRRRMTRPLGRDDLREVARACDVATTAGVRDVLVLVLVYVLGVGPGELAGLRLRHVTLSAGAAAVVLPERRVQMRCELWHQDPSLGWATALVQPASGAGPPVPLPVCPVCLLYRWVEVLSAAGITGETAALLRAVDRGGVLAGLDGYRGRAIAGEGMGEDAIRALIRRVAVEADLDEAVRRRPVTALRLGGALELRDRGELLPVVAAHAGYPPDSGMLARYLAVPAIARP